MSQARSWLCTFNNPTGITSDFLQEYLEMWHKHATYVNGQIERGANGTLHVQYFVNFSKPHRLAALKKICGKSHFTPVSRDNGASDYCLKEETRVAGPLELGIKPARKNVAGETAERNKKILEIGVEECVAQGLVHMKEYLKLK